MRIFNLFLSICLLAGLSLNSHAQEDSLSINKKKRNHFIIGATSAYTLSLIGLNELWYKDFPRQEFHFFDDSKEWKQMDKFGHTLSTYQISRLSYQAISNIGLSERKSFLWSGAVGLLFMTPIEILDGFSAEYGASASDLLFNLGGATLFVGQGLLWKEQRLYPKYSFQRSNLASKRPNVLGSNLVEEFIKDYNGINYWLSADIYKFLKNESKFPKWLNLAIGYGANDMIYADNTSNKLAGYSSYRQYYLGLDFDLTHIQTKSKIIKGLLFVINTIHLPAPTLEINDKGQIKFHPLYF